MKYKISVPSRIKFNPIVVIVPRLQTRGQFIDGDIPDMSAPMEVDLGDVADYGKRQRGNLICVSGTPKKASIECVAIQMRVI